MTPAPRFHTTTIPAGTTATQIGDLLRRYGCRRYAVEWDDNGDPMAVWFTMHDPIMQRMVDFKMSAQVEGVEARRVSRSAPALDIAWRQLHAWVELSLEIIENGVRHFHEVFAADLIGEGGERAGDMILQRALGPGDGGG